METLAAGLYANVAVAGAHYGYGTIFISSETSSNLRPMKRLMENTVFSGLVTAWRLATCPTRRSDFVKPTTEGVIRLPSGFVTRPARRLP